VRIYRRIAFEKKENIPNVTIFKGSEIRPNRGFRVTLRIERIIPPKTYVLKPPVTTTPSRPCPRANRERPFIEADLMKDFILK
ncbi:MAG: hypothetical protein ACD_37C00107G0001, partial [uncultured bacterium]